MNEVDRYIEQFHGVAYERLRVIRTLITKLVPDAEEGIMYGLVGYKLRGKPLVYFGGFAKHIGLYATPNGHEAFAKQFSVYKQGKGSVQFPLDKPLPIELIREVILFRKEQIGG